jgi:hypothetical protein
MNNNFSGFGKGNNRAVKPLNGRNIYYKLTTIEEVYNAYQNKIVLPSGSNILLFGIVQVLLSFNMLF